MTAQHLRDLAQSRRAATVAAAAIRLEAELTDVTLLMFDKLMGGLPRRAERRASDNAASALCDADQHLGVLAGPVLFVAGPLLGWAAFVARRYHLSWWAMTSLLIWLAYMATIILLLDTLCDGQFVCWSLGVKTS